MAKYNRIGGGRGDDRRRGADGADTFVISAGRDMVRDFTPGEDVLDLGDGEAIGTLEDVWDAAR